MRGGGEGEKKIESRKNRRNDEMIGSWERKKREIKFVVNSCYFFFNDTATTEIYTLSLHELFRSQKNLPSAEPNQIM